MSPVLIDNARICADARARPGSVLIEGNRITAVAHTNDDRAALRSRAASIVDGTDHWLIPGMTDAHAHAYGALMRGTENSLPLELWALHTMVIGGDMDGPALKAAILLGAAERIRSGITGTLDHSPRVALAQDSLAAHEASGLRVAFALFLNDISDYDLLDLPLTDALLPLIGRPPKLDADAYANTFATLVQAARAGSGRVSVQLGPNAPQRCSPEAWRLWRDLRDRHDINVHTHLLETRAQASLNPKWPDGLVAEMERHGLLDSRLTCAHGVWLSEHEMATLARHNVTVSHNPASNLMLGSGALNVNACRACGLRLGLGSDSANTGGRADMFALMRLAMMLPRRAEPDFAKWPDANTVFTAATEHGAAALGLAGQTGRIAQGQLADLVLVRANTAATVSASHNLDVLVQHAAPEHVASVMVDGAWVMRDGHILAFDEAAAISDAQSQAERLRDRNAPKMQTLLHEMPTMSARFLRNCG